MAISYRTCKVLSALLICVAASNVLALRASDVPNFRIRVRVLSQGGKDPVGHRFPIRLQTLSSETNGTEWSPWLIYDEVQGSKSLALYPNPYLKGWPLVLRLQINGIVDAARVEAELVFDGTAKVVPLEWELFGPNMGIVLWRDTSDKTAHAATMAAYNRHYWKELQDLHMPANLKPKKFVLVDRFIGGDDDRIDWKEGFENLSRAGFSVVMAPSNRPMKELDTSGGCEPHGLGSLLASGLCVFNAFAGRQGA